MGRWQLEYLTEMLILDFCEHENFSFSVKKDCINQELEKPTTVGFFAESYTTKVSFSSTPQLSDQPILHFCVNVISFAKFYHMKSLLNIY